MHIIMHLVWAWIKQPLICMMVTNGNVQAIVYRRLQRIIDIIASTQKSEDGEVFVRFLSSSYSAIAISLDLRVS